MKKKINGKFILSLLMMTVPIGLIIYFLVSEQGLLDLVENASKLNAWWLFAGVAFHFTNIFIDAVVLYIIAKSYGVDYSFKSSLRATAVGQFFTVVTPAAVGAQPMQAYCMSKQNVDGGVASSCLLQKFLVYQTTITVYSFVAMLCNLDLFYGDLRNLMLSLALFGFLSHVVIVSFMYVISFNRKLASSIINVFFKFLSKIKIIKNPEEKLEKLNRQMEFFHDGNTKLYKNKKLLAAAFLLTAIQLTFLFAIPYAIYKAFYLICSFKIANFNFVIITDINLTTSIELIW